MLSVQKKVGLTLGVAALLVAIVNSVELITSRHVSFGAALVTPFVYTLLIASLVPFLTAVRDNRVGKTVQVLTILGLGFVATALNPPGDLTGIILVAVALALSAQYELLGLGIGPRLLAAVVLYGGFAVGVTVYRFKEPWLAGIDTLIGAGSFLYLFWVVFAEEIRVRRRSERKLRESELRYQRVIEESNMMATNQDLDLRYTWVYNPHDCLRDRVLQGRSDAEIYAPDEARSLRNLKGGVIETAEGAQVEFRARLDGEDRIFDLTIQPLHDERGVVVGVGTTSREITERVALRERIVRSERLAAAGQLATYLAHEVNSPLQSITSTLAVVRRRYTLQPGLEESLGLLSDAFTTIKGTVEKLLDLNRPIARSERIIDLNEIIRNTFALTASMLKQRRIEAVVRLPRAPLLLYAAPQLLAQVFLNLINNSVEAMQRDTGDSSPPADERERRITVSGTSRHGRITVRFSDSGPGFTDEGLRRAFDPFHSEKSKIGMGIGLSICLQNVQKSGGTIDVRNRSEGGAVFTIELPEMSRRRDHDDAGRPS